VGIIYRASLCLTKVAIRTLYYALVYPYLQYCVTLWGSTYPYKLNRLLLLQKRVIRIVNKVEFDAHTDPLFKDNQIFKFKDIYFYNLGKFMFLYINNRLSRNFDNLVLRVKQVHGYGLRRAELLYVPLCRTKLRQYSVSYQGSSFFNTLSSDIRNAPTLQQFQFKLRYFLFSRL
jgi:hypothetical protein